MPIYEFSCRKCGKEFEKLVASSASPVICPSCRSRKVEKMFSLFGTKSGGRFISSSGSSCNGCTAKSCSSCK